MAVERHEAVDAATVTIANRLSARAEEIASRISDAIAARLPEYRALPPTLLHEDHANVIRVNILALLNNLGAEDVFTTEALEVSRHNFARRARQGVSLGSALQSIRIWGQMMWAAVLDVTQQRDEAEREAALAIAARVMEHVDAISRVAEEHWLEDARSLWSEREVLRRDLLELLIAGKGADEAAGRQADALGVRLADHYAVVLARGGDLGSGVSLGSHLRDMLRATRRHLRPGDDRVLVGMRYAEVVALYPVAGYADLDELKRRCADVAQSLVAVRAKVGLGGWHPGMAGVASSYGEAREAVAYALRSPRDVRFVAFDDIVIDHLLRSSQTAQPLLADTLRRLREYDRRGRSQLVTTLRTYLDNGTSVTRTAAKLHVHANTIVYRLGRVRDITGRDPSRHEDLLVLTLALKLGDLEADDDPGRP